MPVPGQNSFGLQLLPSKYIGHTASGSRSSGYRLGFSEQPSGQPRPSTTVKSNTEATAERAAGNANVRVDRSTTTGKVAEEARAYSSAEAANLGLPGFTKLSTSTDVLESLTKAGINVDLLPSELINSSAELLICKPVNGKVRIAAEVPSTSVAEGGTFVFEVSGKECKVIDRLPAGQHVDVKPEEVLAYRAPGTAAFRTNGAVKEAAAGTASIAEDQAATANRSRIENWKEFVHEHKGAATGIGVGGVGVVGTGVTALVNWLTGDEDPNVPPVPSPSGEDGATVSATSPVDLSGLIYDPASNQYFDQNGTPVVSGAPVGGSQPNGASAAPWRQTSPSTRQAMQSFIANGQIAEASALAIADQMEATKTSAADLVNRIERYAFQAWDAQLADKLTAGLANDLGRFVASLPATRRRDLVTLIVICVLGADSGMIVDHDSDFDLYKIITARLAKPANVNGSMAFPEARGIAQAILSSVLLD